MTSLKFEPVQWEGNALVLIDQRKLPNQFTLIRCRKIADVWHAIHELAVRGAPAIGIAAGYGVYVGLLEKRPKDRVQFFRALKQIGAFLKASRPTAVNLAWAVDRIEKKVQKLNGANVSGLMKQVFSEAKLIHKEDQALCRLIGRSGNALIHSTDHVLTHCNAGGLATSGFGTALAVLFTAKEKGKKLNVFATETRPLLQGARLTMWELKRYGIPSTLVCDSAVGTLMRQGKVKKVIVGADRIARNGDTANKIGTYQLASLAKGHGIPFYIAAPVSTFDFAISDGKQIPIEERASDEIVKGFGKRTAPSGIQVYNPAFDVTPHELITAFITDRGVLKPPYSKSFQCLKK
jgi:methylthioribose-1-phosphate isomerase